MSAYQAYEALSSLDIVGFFGPGVRLRGVNMIRKHMTWVLAALLMTASVSWAGNLRVGSARVNGDQVTVPIMLDGDVGKGVSTLNFKLDYDPNLFEPLAATAGKAASAADKSVQANAPAKGEYRVIMMGLNQNALTSGEVANIVLRKVGSSDTGRAELTVSQTTFSSPEGVEIPSQGGKGVIDLSGKAPAPGTEQNSPPADAPGVTPPQGQPAAPANKDSVTTPATAKPDPNAPGAGQNPSALKSAAAPGSSAAASGLQPFPGAVTGPMSSTPGKSGVPATGPGSLAAAVQRVDAAHSALQAQTGGSAIPGAADSASATNSANGESGSQSTTGSSSLGGVDKAPPSDGTMQLAKVATPDASGQAQKKVLEKSAADGVQSASTQKTGRLGLKVALGCVVVAVLGVVFVVRRKLFT